MFKRASLAGMAVFALALTPWAVTAQEKKEQPKPPAKPDKPPAPTTQPAGTPPAGMTAEEMQAVMAAMMPGPAHQKLAKLAGEWTVQAKLAAPGAPAEETQATSKITVVLDGRFIHEDYSGTMMGMPFMSTHILGYNNGAKKYEGLWAYTLGTGVMFLSGTSTDDGKTIKCDASFDNEVGVKETVTITYKVADDDHFTVSLGGGKMPDGSPGPTMDMTYARKK